MKGILKRETVEGRGHSDWFILLSVLGMMFFSVAFVYSASAGFADARTGSAETFFWSHLIRVGAGVGILLLFARLDYHWLERWSKPLLVLAIGMLLYVLFEGTRIKGATRWIDLGLISFQPSEVAKFALVMHLGVMLADKRDYLNDFKFAVLPMLVWIGIVAALVALQPNLSTALVISTLGFGVLFMGRVKLWHLAAVTLPALAGAGLYAISAEYRMRRIMGFIGMHSGESSGIETAGYQLKQGLLAFGSGGLFGVGPGQSHQRLFVPEPFGDFIYSIIGEEYGFAGTTFLMLVFGVIIWRGLLVARQAPDDLGRNLAAGITMAVGLYAIVNAGVTTGLLPTTGLPMPFVSYGGSSVLFSAAAVGVLLNISRYANVMPYRREQPKVVEGVVA
ncbi:MAG: cell division protein FtsW [Ignavibacteriae bacterium]|nr:cell division protein FtsW [Ignavibacteriota bacterium]MCB9217551.1 cell division protein FtsW [Ignavibacteria bacterium]